MPKPNLIKKDSILESQIIKTLLAGLHEWRPDLKYPESHSDMQACARGLMKMFKIERLPLLVELKIECYKCGGIGYFITPMEGYIEQKECDKCLGKGWIE